MKQFIVYNLQTGEIQKTGICSEHDFYLQAQDGESVIEGLAIANFGYVLNGNLIAYTTEQQQRKANKPEYDCEWSNEIFDWIDVRTNQQKYDEASGVIKITRNELLVESDWTQLPDVILANKQDWAVYRQALRDIPQQSGYPFNIIWPVKPE
jgi:hypothetical protein